MSAPHRTGIRTVGRSPSVPGRDSRRLASRVRQGIVAASYGPRDQAVRRTLVAADVLAVSLALVAVAIVIARRHAVAEVLWGLLTIPGWLLLFNAYRLYERDSKRISHSTVDDIPWLFHALVVGSLLMWLYYPLVVAGGIQFANLLGFACFTVVGVLAFRSLGRRAVGAAMGPERVLLLGGGEPIRLLADKMRAHPEYAVQPVAQIASPQTEADGADLPTLAELQNLDLSAAIAEHNIDRVVITHGELDERMLLELLRRCKELSLKVSVLPQLCDAMGPSVEIDDVEGVTLLGINPPVLSPSSRIFKRGMDVLGATAILIASCPLMAMIAIAVKLTSSGPVLFRQTRIGKGGERFELLKFRTMVIGAEHMTDGLRAQSIDPGWLHLEHDPRITPIGRRLRASSLDELPQVWNVLKGEMSLVGPRPLVESEDRQLIGWARSRIDLTPGLTGLWQVLGRTSIPFDEMIKLDYIYVTNWSLWTDIRLMLRTLPVIVSRRGAN